MTPLLIGLLRRIYPRYGVWVSELGLRQVAGSAWEFLLKLATAAMLMVAVMSLTASFQIKELAFAIFFFVYSANVDCLHRDAITQWH
ncbi:MAG: hypothetical protein LRY40_02590 [Shewanella fodinae]|nr:hypothetical protein [Shewanella fodinae]